MPSSDILNQIPRDEREKFAKYLYRYGYGDVIIREGQTDTAIYLLRAGSVGIFIQTLGEQKKIATIDAVNLFGEIAPIIESPRTATVWVTSAEAVVYKFNAFDLKVIYANPTWTELLITRLCNDIRDANHRSTLLEAENAKLANRSPEIVKQVAVLLSALVSLQNSIASSAVMNSKEWQYPIGLREMTIAYIQKYLPEVYALTGDDGSDAALGAIIDKGLLPENLKNLLKR